MLIDFNYTSIITGEWNDCEWLWIVVNSCCESSRHSLEAAVSHGYTTFTEKGICSSYLSPGFDPGKCYNVLNPVTKLKYPPGSSTLATKTCPFIDDLPIKIF